MKTVVNYDLKGVLKKKNLYLVILGIVSYTFSVALIGIYAQKYGIVGNSLKSFKQNIFTPINYFKGITYKSEPLILDINHKNIMKIEDVRSSALKRGMLIAKDSKWVNFIGKKGNKNIQGKLRLKGWLGDHWERGDGLLSYKVKLKGDQTILGMKRFAIQHPRTRGYMDEWYFQKLVKYAGLISSRNYYLPIILNGKKYPIYHIEENFEKRLIENNQRREGPIFKLFEREYVDEERMTSRKSVISFYQKEKWTSTDKGNLLLRRAERLMKGFLSGEYKPEEVFDVELFARAWALADLLGHHHSIKWGNLRYYLNPVSGLIEPIVFDNSYVLSNREKGLLGEQIRHGKDSKMSGIESSNLIPSLVKVSSQTIYPMLFSEKFRKSYVDALIKYSDKNWLDNFFLSIKNDEENTLRSFYKSYPWYKFDKSILYSNQKYISSKLNPSSALQSFIIDNENDKKIIKIKNNHSLPIEIVGVKIKGNNNIFKFEKSYSIPNKPKYCSGYDCFYYISSRQPYHEIPDYIDLENLLNDLQMSKQLTLVSKVSGTNNLIEEPIFSSQESANITPLIDDLVDLEFINIDQKNKQIFIKNGVWNLNKDLIIPPNYSLNINKNTTINMLNESAIISYSEIYFKGNKDNPIIIKSEDFSGQGILVLKTKGKSKIENVIFENLSMLKRAGLEMTGSVTFYESDVVIKNAIFKDNKSEDSLNIIRSKFILENSDFLNSYSDALDLDFSDGRIIKSRFYDIGNDGIDLSGSEVSISNVYLKNIGDKGISIGEKSIADLKEININKSIIGLACKDSSNINGKIIRISSSEVGLATYQKKSEFGPCYANLESLQNKNNKQIFLVEKDSILKIDKEIIKPNSKNVYRMLYPSN